MAEEIDSSPAASSSSSSGTKKTSLWPSHIRWIPTSTDHIIAAEKRLLSLVKIPYTQEKVIIGSGLPEYKVRCFKLTRSEPRFINTVTFGDKEESPTLVMLHDYGSSLGIFFQNFASLAECFRVIAIDQLGWGLSSRPDFTCQSTEESDAWFVDSLEEWREAKKLTNFILLGHSFGGYVAAKYALKHPQHVQRLILVGCIGFASETVSLSCKEAIQNYMWHSNVTPQKLVRCLGPLGPYVVRKEVVASIDGGGLTNEESKLYTDYVYHTVAAKASGELCLKYIFLFRPFVRSPLLHRTSEWGVPTTFIYGVEDEMDYQEAVEARENMKVSCEIIRVAQGGNLMFIENADGFHSAVFYACRSLLAPPGQDNSLPKGLELV